MRTPVTPFEVSLEVRAAMRGSQPAFAWLYRTFAPLVHSIHLGMGTRAQAEELTQETFEIAFARMQTLREAHLFGPWIAAIARRNVPRRRTPQVLLLEDDVAPDTAAGPDDSAEAQHVLRAIRTLPEAYRDTLLLRLVEGMSGPEIAALTGLTPPSVRVNLHRGMARLRIALGLPATQEEAPDATAT